ncbi:MAG TPA: MFS transporter [Methanoculleus sp.]|jgi:MFS family permease|uniref:MFS transporter n=1 Tax=Methanoculleus sp. TaxID=90427 RepID=UPI001B732A7C|nr:MFS transporter [Methanoculleus sp.]MBP7144798.1 MFS transporter [Methanoculleus sp.]HOC84083.1 MFS transporter [Methanoculleus sp.]HOF96614.1 MFS transporter [Methanoculleus sp.]HOI61338.1 MFS transporter [Methanoculleus sp.]HPM54084.1 MFS transporter [Methanoculleus sp.]
MNTARRIYNVLFISVFATMLGLGIVSPLLPIYAENLGATGIWLGVIFSAFALSRSVFMPIIGRISDRRGRKWIILTGMFAYAVLSLAYLIAGSVYSLTAVRFAHGLASAMVVPIAMAYIADLSEKGKEGSHMGNFSISMFLGMGVGPLLGGFLNDTFGMPSVFYAMAGLSAFATLLVAISLPEAKPGGFALPDAPSTPMPALITLPVMQGVMVFAFISALGRGGMMVFVPVFGPLIAISPFEVGIVLSANTFLMALLQVPIGRLTDTGNKVALIVAGSTIAAIALAVIPLTHSFLPLLLVTSLIGVGGAIQQPAIMALTVDAGRTIGMGTSMGAYNTVFGIGMIIAPLMGGAFMDFVGIEAVFYVGGAISLIGTVIFAAMMQRSARREVAGETPGPG